MTLSRQQKITTILLALYWPALFVFAHVPIPQVVRQAGVSDKSLHFLAYFILAFLLWFTVSGGKRVNWRKAAPRWVLLTILVYGILDEWSQSYVAGRSCDVLDFFADLAGTLIGLILFSVFTLWPAGLLVTATVIFGMTNVAQKNLAELLPVASAAFHLFAYAIFTMLWVRFIFAGNPPQAD
ncbi:MAG: VanZ family protein [Planctomycetota bacterium]|jgi:VanZ family protein